MVLAPGRGPPRIELYNRIGNDSGGPDGYRTGDVNENHKMTALPELLQNILSKQDTVLVSPVKISSLLVECASMSRVRNLDKKLILQLIKSLWTENVKHSSEHDALW